MRLGRFTHHRGTLTAHTWAICAAVALGGLLLASCSAAPAVPSVPVAQPNPAPLTVASDTTPANMPPVIFVMLDWMNGDWGNPDYRFSYVDPNGYRNEFRGHPEWGALGGWSEFRWSDLNPAKGVYDWSKLDKYIKDAQLMSVTLADGTVIPKPVGIGIVTWEMQTLSDRIGVNYTPTWVGTEMGTSVSSCVDPDGATGPCLPFCVPRWSNSVWRYWFNQFVLAMGQRYDNNPEFFNLAFFLIATGADGETVERKNTGGCTYQSGNTLAFDQWILQVMGTYNLAFPNTVQMIQATLHSIPTCSEHAASFPSKMTGVKVNGMEVDVFQAEYYMDGVLKGGVTGFSELYHEIIPTGYEPKHGNGIAGSYLYYMESLATQPHMYDTQLRNIEDTYYAEQQTGFPIQNFVRTHLGKNVHTTPDVWILLRDTNGRDDCWTGSNGIRYCITPHRGDYGFFLDRRQSAPGSATVILKSETLAQLPLPARNHIYGSQSARRTDQASGNIYMSFDIHDDYRYAGMIPKAAGGQVSWIVTATLVNTGGDTFSLEYKDYFGNIVERRATKGAALGPLDNWVDYTWVVDDAFFNNGLPGGCDFRISCNNDGNEFMHRVFVRGLGPPPPTPTPTLTRPPTSTSTLTPVPTRTATRTNTPTGTITPPTPTNTATPYIAPTRTPTPTQSPTITPSRAPTDTPTPGPSLTPTNSPTPFPGGRNTITLQQSIREYMGTTDGYISAWNPAGTFGHQANLLIKNDAVYYSLLRFDLASLPAGATINQATLRLYAYYRDKTQAMDVLIYPLRRPWVDTEATWLLAGSGDPWALPGADDTTYDRESLPIATANVAAVNTWYAFDVTASVQKWASSIAVNHGWLLRGSGSISVVYHFASAQHSTLSLHPQLIIDYTTPEVPLTPTPVTPTSTATSTATATSAPTLSPTPTVTGTPQAPDLTPTSPPTPSVTPTESGAVTPSPSPVPGDTGTVIDFERRTTVLEQLLRAIIHILRRAGRTR